MSLRGYLKLLLNNIRTKNSTYFPIVNTSSKKIEFRIYAISRLDFLKINGRNIKIYKKNKFRNIYSLERKKCLFDGENIITIEKKLVFGMKQIIKKQKKPKFQGFDEKEDYLEILSKMTIKNKPFTNFFQTAYDFQDNEYRLQSWVWTSAIPYYCLLKIDSSKYQKILNNLINEIFIKIDNSLYSGAFEIRWDINSSTNQIDKIIAPNDLSMMVNYILLETYKLNKDHQILSKIMNISDWIIENSVFDEGLIMSGFSTVKNSWDKSWLYVDSGFILTLFSELYKETKDCKYYDFSKNFSDQYIKKFYDLENKYFIKTIYFDTKITNKTFFTRGQAWALEGLISWYAVVKEENIYQIISNLIKTLVKFQNKNGSWNYIADNPKSGECAKTTPIIAYQMLRFLKVTREYNENIIKSVNGALKWCRDKLKTNNKDFVGIDSFTIEGNIVGKRYSSSSFTYSIAYYLLANHSLNNIKKEEKYGKLFQN